MMQPVRTAQSSEWFSHSLNNRLRRVFHPVLIKTMALTRPFRLQVEGNAPMEPCIFVASHQSMYDVLIAGEAIGRHIFVFASDEDKRTISGLPFRINGVIWVCRKDKQDRKRATDDLVACLNAGKSVLMFPEATWNLTPNRLLLPMNWGAVRLSKQTGVPICPLYLLFCEKTCFVQIGDPYLPTAGDVEAIEDLRNRMATLCFRLMEGQPLTKRTSLPDDYAKKSLLRCCGWYPRAKRDPMGFAEYESQFIFRPKNVTEQADAFSHLSHLTPSVKTAFLFNKKPS